jgi:hypothetical protein
MSVSVAMRDGVTFDCTPHINFRESPSHADDFIYHAVHLPMIYHAWCVT